MVVALFGRHTLYFVLKIFWIRAFQFLIAVTKHLVEFVGLLVGQEFIGKENFVYYSIEHASSEDSGEILLIRFRSLAREYTDELSASVELLNRLEEYIPELEKAALPECFVMGSKLVWELVKQSIQDLVHLWVDMVPTHQHFVRSCRRYLYLSAERAVLFVTLVLLVRLASCNIWIAL